LALVKVGTGTAAFGTQNSENAASFNNGATSVTITGNSGNTFSGGLYIQGGSVYGASNDAFGTGTIGLNGGTFATFSTVAHAYTNPISVLAGTSQIGDTTRTGALDFNGNVFLNANGTINVSSAATFSGVVSGSFNLSKGGSSTLTLNGSNTYTGQTNVTAGTLAVRNSAGLNSTPAVVLSSGGTLSVSAVAPFSTPATLTYAGTGGNVVGAVVHSAGTVSPGGTNRGNFSAGTVVFNDGLTLNAGGSVYVDLNGGTNTLGAGTNDPRHHRHGRRARR
jgi:autotransporter-associated beta strand protein